MLEKIKNILLTQSGFYTGLFSFLAIGAWSLNGLYGKHFVVNDLMSIYGWIIGQVTVKHGIDSVFNSPKGEEPK